MVDYMPEWIERGNLRYTAVGVSAIYKLITRKAGKRVMDDIEHSIKNEAATKREWQRQKRIHKHEAR